MASSFLFGILVSPAAAQLLGPEFQVNSYTTDTQSLPGIAADGSGNFVVVWNSFLQDGSGYGVFGQRYDSAGLRVGSEFQVNTYTLGWQNDPAVAADGSGSFVVVWDSWPQDGSGPGVFGQRYDSAGLRVGSEFQVNSYTTYTQHQSAVAIDGSGGFVVVWNSDGQDGWGAGVFGQRFDSAGAAVGSEFRVNSYTPGDQYWPAVAAAGAGDFVVVWMSGYSQDGSSYGIFGQRFDAAGLPMGGEFQVNSYTTNYQARPAVAIDGSGGFVVVWYSVGQDGSSAGVFGQRYDSAGLRVGSEFRVNSDTVSTQFDPAVTADGSGKFFVSWSSTRQIGSSYDIFGKRFDSAGHPLQSEFLVNSHTAYDQHLSATAVGASGSVVVVWASRNQDGQFLGVFGQRLSAPPFFFGDFETGDFGVWSFACNAGEICP